MRAYLEKKNITKRRAGEVVQGICPEFEPRYLKNRGEDKFKM
jgi:hypothetical protein